MINNIKLSLILVLTLFAKIVLAVEDNIAIVNMQEVLTKSIVGKERINKYEKYLNQLEKKHRDTEKTLRQDNQSLIKKRAILSEQSFSQKKHAFEKKVLESQKQMQQSKNNLSKFWQLSAEKISEHINEIIKAIVQEKSYKIILYAQQTIYFDKKIDITLDVIRRLNKSMDKLNLDLESVKKK